jgi:hypothetical protein
VAGNEECERTDGGMDGGIVYGDTKREYGFWWWFCPVPCDSIEFLDGEGYEDGEWVTHGGLPGRSWGAEGGERMNMLRVRWN